MGLSRKHLNTHSTPVDFDPVELGRALESALPEAVFGLLLGSARDGRVALGADLDLAFYLSDVAPLDFFRRVDELVDAFAPEVRSDVGILNRAEPVFRYEALKGRLLFCRDEALYGAFFSKTCREYEHQIADYERQKRYREEARNAG